MLPLIQRYVVSSGSIFPLTMVALDRWTAHTGVIDPNLASLSTFIYIVHVTALYGYPFQGYHIEMNKCSEVLGPQRPGLYIENEKNNYTIDKILMIVL